MTYKTLLLLLLISYSCAAQNTPDGKGLLKGFIGIYEGNCMPSPGTPPCEPKPHSTTIYITSLSEKFENALIIDSVKSNELGEYKIKLDPGTYSLFLRDEERVICDVIQCPDQCYCNPFEIVQDSTTVIDANIDHATW
ncbi:hypothetical protein [Ekhidna sp.]|uniref:hypothetical protein n=1 Tax=Ekhidna sp. TaxID=2608089 RepID=UPI003CCB826D